MSWGFGFESPHTSLSIGAFLQSFLASLDLVLYVLAMVPCGNMIDSNDWISGWCSGVRLIHQVSYRGEPLSWSSARSLWKNSSLQQLDLHRLWLLPLCRAFASQTWISWLSGAWTARPWASGTSSAVGIDSMGRHGMRFQGTCSTCGSLPALGNWCLQFRSAQNLKWMWCIGNWLEAIEHFGSTNCVAIWTIKSLFPYFIHLYSN